ncbi:cartilage intermediate layer protein 2-like [Saccostrea cucullata]|uniref:cartilage intermediate layer protein 2-like n=1 Tax=Saccostrea cuccullata TaxID=36930 RepID=UPI002ED46314
MSSSVKFNSFDDRYVHTTDEQPTIIAVSSGIATKKIALIFGAIVVVGIIATVGVILGVVILKKDHKGNDQPPAVINGPIDGKWTYWDSWSDCTVTCSGGKQRRTRSCTSPPPMFGGNSCVGNSEEIRQCSTWNCPEKPWISRKPVPKIRFVGQSATFCCEANGFPLPIDFIWFKDDNLLPGMGTNGNLVVSSIQKSDAGAYYCKATTEAGSVTSERVTLDVRDTSYDTCNPVPTVKEETLPTGCYFNDKGNSKSVVNVGKCPNSKCITNTLADNGTCEDWWPPHCCDVSQTETIEIECSGGFTYPITKVISCKCRENVINTLLNGIAYGVQNGTRIPFVRGEVMIDGEVKSVTSATGYFSVNVLGEVSRVVMNLRNDRSGQLLDTKRVIDISYGTTTSIDIHVPLKPAPKTFNTHLGFDIPLGMKNGNSATARLSIAAGSVVDGNGNAFDGTANARVHYVDQRNLEDLDEMYGELRFTDEEGDSVDLETFGMLQLSVEDNSGTPLYVNGKIKMSLDPAPLNLSNEGENLHLYSLDVNTGKWVDQGLMPYTSSSGSSRKRRSTGGNLEGIVTDAIPVIDLTQIVDNIIKVSYTRLVSLINISLSRPRIYRIITEYRTVVSHDVVTRHDACFVRVKAYTDFTFRNAADGVRIIAATRTKNGGPFRGKMSMITNNNVNSGILCMPIFCNSDVYLAAEKNGKYYASDNHILPSVAESVNVANGTQVKLNSDYVNREGPVFLYQRRPQCEDNAFSSFVFQFAPLLKEGERNSLSGDNVHNQINSWYTEPSTSPFRRTCFMKVKVVSNEHTLRAIGVSRMEYVSNVPFFGTFQAPIIWDETTNNRREKAACIEFRCPGRLIDGTNVINNIATLLRVQILSQEGHVCNITNVASGLNITRTSSILGGGFEFRADPNDNYGVGMGVFIRTFPFETARSTCRTGLDSTNISPIMKPNSNPAVELECII